MHEELGGDDVRKIYSEAGGLAFGLLYAVAFVAAGGAMVSYQLSHGIDVGYLVIGFGLAGFGLFVFVPFLKQVLRGSLPVIVMDEVGIADMRTSAGFVRWSQVLSVTAAVHKGRTYSVMLALMDPLPTASKPGGGSLRSRLSALMGRPGSRGKLSISTLGISVDGDTLYNMCLGYARAHKFEKIPE